MTQPELIQVKLRIDTEHMHPLHKPRDRSMYLSSEFEVNRVNTVYASFVPQNRVLSDAIVKLLQSACNSFYVEVSGKFFHKRVL